MIKRLITTLFAITLLAGSGLGLAFRPAVVQAATDEELQACAQAGVSAADCDNSISVSGSAKQQVCRGAGLGAECQAPAGSPTVDNTLKTVVNIFSFIVGFAAVIMIIIGGFRYITSGGDSNATSGAKNTILYAIIGLVVVALAQVIVQFVINKV